MSGKHLHSGGSKPHPSQKKNDVQCENHRISGDMNVRGEVTVEIGPKEANARQAEKAENDAKRRKQWWLEVATFVVLTIYAGLTAIQSHESKRTADAAIAANQQAETATKLDERPWINIVQVVPVDAPDGSEALSVKVENFGRTPAFHAHTRIFFQTVAPETVPVFAFKEEEARGEAIYSPNASNTVNINGRLPPEVVMNFKTGASWGYIGIALWYDDYWHVHQMDVFCQLYDIRSGQWVGRKQDCKN